MKDNLHRTILAYSQPPRIIAWLLTMGLRWFVSLQRSSLSERPSSSFVCF